MRHDDEHQQSEGRIKIGNYTAGDIALFKDIAEAAADSAVQKMFVVMGHDPKEPLTAQLDAAWTRRMRLRSEGVVGKVLAIVLSVSVLGALGTMWSGFKIAVSNTPPTTLPHP